MVNYPAYCSKCDMITGHTTTGLDSTCDKCGYVGKRKAPYLSWITLGCIGLGIAGFSLWIIYNSLILLGILH